MSTRSSVYLAEKAASLQQALEFFLTGQNQLERHLVFLAQIDFWDWEIETLMFAFENYEVRSRAWNSVQGLLNGITANKLNVKLSEKQERSLRVERGTWRSNRKVKVVAPTSELVQLLETWHQVLDVCEPLIRTPQKQIDAFGLNCKADLSGYRKVAEDIEVPDEPEDEPEATE